MDDWDYEIPLKLYSVTAKGRNVHNLGEFKADESLITLSEGGFGLEWYHDEYAYQYMRYGNSFSLSRYLSAGIPVIVPKGISCQKLIEENHLGIIVGSLDETVKTIESMSESEYKNYVQHVQRFAPALRNGYYTQKCLIDSVQALFREDIGKAFVQGKDIYEVGDYEFLSTSLMRSYGGNLALSWNLKGKPDGFLIYDTDGNFIDETENSYQHYMLITGYKEAGLVVKAYVNTQKGKMVVAKSEPVYPGEKSYGRPSVSIVIPAYNAEAGIIRSIDTVLAQTFPDLEIVVVDDGSADHTPDILDWYAHNYPSIIVIHQQNAGVQAARNAGILCAKGEFTGFVDSDDMIRPDMIERLYTSAIENQCDIAITSAYQIESRGYNPILQQSVRENMAITVEGFLQAYASGGYAMPAVWNKLYRTSLIKEHLFPPIRYEDEAWTPYVLSYADTLCYRNDLSYEYDRSTCTSSLVDQWAGKSKEEVFQDHKRSILFYLENGNPERIGVLRKLARSELGLFSRAIKYDGYKILLKQIEENMI